MASENLTCLQCGKAMADTQQCWTLRTLDGAEHYPLHRRCIRKYRRPYGLAAKVVSERTEIEAVGGLGDDDDDDDY